MQAKKTTHSASEPREFLRDCRRILGDTFLMRLFKGMSKNELEEDSKDRASFNRKWQRWTAQRPFVGEEAVRENYLEKHEIILRDLMDQAGGEEVARGIVARQAHIVGCELRCLESVEPDKCTIHEECLDDLPALSLYHAALTDPKGTPEMVRAAWQRAKQELDENFELWTRKQEE